MQGADSPRSSLIRYMARYMRPVAKHGDAGVHRPLDGAPHAGGDLPLAVQKGSVDVQGPRACTAWEGSSKFIINLITGIILWNRSFGNPPPPGSARSHVARRWRALLPLANILLASTLVFSSSPFLARGAMGETSPLSLRGGRWPLPCCTPLACLLPLANRLQTPTSAFSLTSSTHVGVMGRLPPCRWGVMGECRGGLRGTPEIPLAPLCKEGFIKPEYNPR